MLRQPHGEASIVMSRAAVGPELRDIEDPYTGAQREWEKAASGHFKQEQVDLIHVCLGSLLLLEA